MSLAIGTRLGPYEITAQIGSGGMGEVYKAHDTRLDRDVAIKTSREKYSERFEREMRAIASLSHPNICVLYDVGPDYLVMELLEGQTLQQLLQSRRLTNQESIRIAEQMAEALHAAHAKGITHRDIKPGNVFVSPRGHAKVLDFGLAKLTAEPQGPDAETQTMGSNLSTPGQAMGTAPYMAPEQARGLELDARADIWALGVVFYEMLTGSRPFEGTTLALVYDAILNKPAPLSNVPAELQSIVAKLLEKDRDRRYQTASAAEEDLRRFTSGTFIGAPAETAAPPPPEPASAPSTAPSRFRNRRRWRRMAPWAIPVFVIYGMTSRWFRSPESQPASSPIDNRLPVVVGEFANRTQDAVWNDTLREAMTVQMQQSDAFLPLSPQQISNLLEEMDREPKAPLSPELAQEVCKEAKGYAALNGTITQIGASYALLLTAASCETGQLLGSSSAEVETKENVLGALEGMARDLRFKMTGSLPADSKWRIKSGARRPPRPDGKFRPDGKSKFPGERPTPPQ
jgi:serine/threonine protein kinase